MAEKDTPTKISLACSGEFGIEEGLCMHTKRKQLLIASGNDKWLIEINQQDFQRALGD